MVSDKNYLTVQFAVNCLNPCSNGIWSLTKYITVQFAVSSPSLNPCSNGIWSLTGCRKQLRTAARVVLILVLMEYGL